MLEPPVGTQFTFMPRKRVSAICEACMRETRGWVVVALNIGDDKLASAILCKGCAR
jgi:hypothetical protein